MAKEIAIILITIFMGMASGALGFWFGCHVKKRNWKRTIFPIAILIIMYGLFFIFFSDEVAAASPVKEMTILSYGV